MITGHHLVRAALVRGLVTICTIVLPTYRVEAGTTTAATISGLPLTTSGIHFGMEYNYLEPTVHGYKTKEGNVDYVAGADADMHNIPPRPGKAWHDKYLSWSRDAAGRGVQRSIAWYRRYHPDWLLYNGNQVTLANAMGDIIAPLDFTNPAVQTYVLTKWIYPALAGGFQGILFDNNLGFNYLHAAGHYSLSGKWIQLYNGNFRDPKYTAAQIRAFRRIAAALHARYPGATVAMNQGVDCNNNFALNQAGQQYADIIMDQEGFTNSGSRTLPYVAQYANAVCPQGKWLMVARWAQHLGRDLNKGLFLVNPEPYNVSPYMTDHNARARFDLQWALANYLLIKYAHTYFWWGGHSQQAGRPLIMQREYTTAQPIGSPLGGFYWSQRVYMRSFTNGLAIVNPSLTASYAVTFPAGKYRDLYGHAIQRYTLPAHSGLVLLRSAR